MGTVEHDAAVVVIERWEKALDRPLQPVVRQQAANILVALWQVYDSVGLAQHEVDMFAHLPMNAIDAAQTLQGIRVRQPHRRDQHQA